MIKPAFELFVQRSETLWLWSELEQRFIRTLSLHSSARVPGEIKRSRDLRGGRWSWTLTFAQKRSWVGRWSWAEQVGRLLLRVVQVVRQQRCNGHCLSDSVQHSSWNSNCAVLKSLGNGGGHRLNTSIVLAAVHGLSGLFRAVSAVEPFSRPLPTPSPSLIGQLASVDVKQH